MRPEELLELLRVRPFGPLRLFLTDSKTSDISHPEQVIVSRGRVDVGRGASPDGVVERVDHIALIHIVRVEVLPPVTAGSGPDQANGSH